MPKDPINTVANRPVSVVVPADVFADAVESIGTFFEPISRVERHIGAKDFLDLRRSSKRADILRRYARMENQKLLDIGSGFGTNLAVWIKDYKVDGYGVEPGGVGFNRGFDASQKLFVANGIDPKRIIDSVGESLPFRDGTFDIVYSANALEHTNNPELVLREAVRVLKADGILHMEIPNYLSYFEGHYMVLQPPILMNWMLRGWVRLIFRRDSAYVKTLRTQINPMWCRGVVRQIAKIYPIELLSLGEDIFLDRLAHAFIFETETVAGKNQRVIGALQKLNVANWIGRLIVALQGHYPIYLTLRKKAN